MATPSVGFRLPADLHVKLAAMAKAQDVTMTQVLRVAILHLERVTSEHERQYAEQDDARLQKYLRVGQETE